MIYSTRVEHNHHLEATVSKQKRRMTEHTTYHTTNTGSHGMDHRNRIPPPQSTHYHRCPSHPAARQQPYPHPLSATRPSHSQSNDRKTIQPTLTRSRVFLVCCVLYRPEQSSALIRRDWRIVMMVAIWSTFEIDTSKRFYKS
jgi:hypothetical protein